MGYNNNKETGGKMAHQFVLFVHKKSRKCLVMDLYTVIHCARFQTTTWEEFHICQEYLFFPKSKSQTLSENNSMHDETYEFLLIFLLCETNLLRALHISMVTSTDKAMVMGYGDSNT